MFGYGEDTTEQVEDEERNKINQDTMTSNDHLESDIYSPLNGSIVPLSKVNDPIFAEEMMGKGLAIQPESDEVRAPIAGTVSMVTISKHALLELRHQMVLSF